VAAFAGAMTARTVAMLDRWAMPAVGGDPVSVPPRSRCARATA
jgi:hypothetical protein